MATVLNTKKTIFGDEVTEVDTAELYCYEANSIRLVTIYKLSDNTMTFQAGASHKNTLTHVEQMKTAMEMVSNRFQELYPKKYRAKKIKEHLDF